MKKLLLILFVVVSSLSLTSCITEAYATTGIYNEDIEIVVRYGTPYYYDNVLVYYYYNGYYFYPYSYNNTWRFHRYSRPLPPPRHHTHPYTSRPPKHHPHGDGHHGNGHHGNGHYGNGGNHHGGGMGNHGNRPNPQHGNGGHGTRPQIHQHSGGFGHGGHMSRPSTPPRQSNPSMGRGSMGSQRPSGHFGGRR